MLACRLLADQNSKTARIKARRVCCSSLLPSGLYRRLWSSTRSTGTKEPVRG